MTVTHRKCCREISVDCRITEYAQSHTHIQKNLMLIFLEEIVLTSTKMCLHTSPQHTAAQPLFTQDTCMSGQLSWVPLSPATCLRKKESIQAS
jgi:hypothetical protein